MGAAVARTSWGSAEEDEREDLMEDYRGVAEQLETDQCVVDWPKEHGGVDELSPGRATIVLMSLWVGIVAMDDRDMVDLDDGQLRLPGHIQKDYPNDGTPDPVTIDLDPEDGL